MSGYEWEASGEELLEESRSRAGEAPALPAPGSALDQRFDLLQVLGQGGVGVVYRARERESGREVALKLLLEQDAGGARLERFWREGRVTASLTHPGIVRVHSAGVALGRAYLAYELIEGGRTLDLEFERRPLRERVELVRDAALALGHAHQHGVVHRDVKPSNVLVDASGRVRVADFGLALVGGLERLTLTGALVGTPNYMAPEQIAPDESHAVGAATDVWALGVVLYEALTGRLPFPATDLVSLAGQILHGHVPPMRELSEGELSEGGLSGAPRAWEAVCLRALTLDPHERYTDGAALAAAIDEALEGRAPASARRSSGAFVFASAGLALLALAVVGVTWAAERRTATPSARPSSSASARGSLAPAGGRPGWFEALPAARRPPSPLPRGIGFGEAPGEYKNAVDGSRLVWIPPGSYWIGISEGPHQPDERPRHEVRLSGFFLGVFEVTHEQFALFCARTRRDPPQGAVDPRAPITNLTHADARAYCTWANLRLPTEAEWEVGARGVEERTFPWGEEEPGAGTPLYANAADLTLKGSSSREKVALGYRDGYAGPAPVGSFPRGASPWGAHDMAGNVWEWVEDYMAPYPSERQTNPRGPRQGLTRVARGGSSQEHGWGLRGANRIGFTPETRLPNLGFRVAR